MFRLLTVLSISSLLFYCNSPSNKTAANKSSNTNTMIEGKDYVILKRFRVEDKQGFSQALEASSFLLPANWKVNGNVQWKPTNRCIAEMVAFFIKAESPENNIELSYMPVTQFDWSTDPIQLDAMQRGFYPQICTIAQPQDAKGYLSNYFARQLNAKVISTTTVDALQQLMDNGAMKMTNNARSARNYAYSHRGSAAEAIMQFEDGREGLALCTLMQTIVSMPGTQGGMSSNIQCFVGMQLIIKYPVEKREMARKILSTFLGSSRINPQWEAGLKGYFAAVLENIQDQNWKNIQISHEAQQEISNNIIRSWESKNTNSNNSNLKTNSGFSQYLQGVENWTDSEGNKIELSSGYSSAWSKGDGTYLMSSNSSFDPNVELGGTQSWARLKQ